MNVNGIRTAGFGTAGFGAGKPIVYTAKDGSQRVNGQLIGMGALPSFIGKVLTREELQQMVDDEVKSNQGKKMSLADMIKASNPEGARAKFRFVGEDKIYTFGEYIKEIDRRSKKNV